MRGAHCKRGGVGVAVGEGSAAPSIGVGGIPIGWEGCGQLQGIDQRPQGRGGWQEMSINWYQYGEVHTYRMFSFYNI